MPNNEMEIILTLVDKATADIKTAIEGVQTEVKGLQETNQKSFDEMNGHLGKVKKGSEETTKSVKEGFKESAAHVRTFRRDLMLVVGVFSAVISSTREYARYSADARDAVDEFDVSVKNLQSNFGKLATTQFLGASIMDVLNTSIKGYSQLFGLVSNFLSGMGAYLNDEGGIVTQLTKAEQSVKNFNQSLKDAELLYMSGGMSAQDYYNILIAGENQVFAVREMSKTQLNELAMLQMQVGNEDLMIAQRTTAEKIALLKEYQANYNIAHAGMQAITVKLSQTIRTNLSTAIADIVLGAKSAKEAFAEFGEIMLRTLVEYMAQQVVAWVLQKTLLAGTVLSTKTAATAIAASWAKAAALASLATLGANAIPAAAALISTTGLAMGIAMSDIGGVGSGAGGGGGGGFAAGGRPPVGVPSIVGERGPEVFVPDRSGMIIPNNRLNSLGGVSISIQINNPVVTRQDNIDDLVNEISDRLARETERYY